MNVFLVNSLIDINKYIDLDDITDVRIIEGEIEDYITQGDEEK